MQQFKNLEGKTVWLRPTGNNLRMNRSTRTAVVEKVRRDHVLLLIHDRSIRYSIHPANPMELFANNAGYVVYETEQALTDYYRVAEIAKMIRQNYLYQEQWEELQRHQIESIAKILGLIPDESTGQ